MREPEFDPRFVDWLRDGPSVPAGWVLPAVEHHARRHPRRHALRPRWIDAMKAVALRHPLTPAARAVVAVAAIAVAVGLGGLFLSGSPGLVLGPRETSSAAPATQPASAPPTPTPAPSATPAPSPAAIDAASMLAEYLPAWQRGDVAWAEQWLAPDLRTVLAGPPDGLSGAQSFQITPDPRGWEYWEPRGDLFHGGPFWALPTVAGRWDPGALVWAIFRLDAQGRIAIQWLVAQPNMMGVHESAGTNAVPAPDGVVTFLDGCRDAFANRYNAEVDGYAAALACYAPGAGVWISDNDPSGAWTETYTDHQPIASHLDGPIDAWTQADGAYHIVERTGDVVMLGDVAAYPFRQSGSSSCAAGIDLFDLTPDRSKILSHWAICGPDPLPPASLPSEVTGTWGVRPVDLLSVTLGTCDPLGVCGELRWQCHGEACVGMLTYRGTKDDALAFEVTDANTFGCSYDMWGSTVLVEPTPDGLEVSTLGWNPGSSGVTLPRADASSLPSSSPGD